ncbi:endonuclease MutS2 [Paenibacillus sp. J2TS4]|uniref:endonuclease MutS2 n=1 Tax=Paenibacillus sp. J2TS4 TaxID=2807194 RepID=UPI001B2D37AB|nr:DNA mismatch repair protein MutS [Paenibacillus sp. J2TS4]GIP33165.1 endonuclease MutS2 [Paenibacillus sp. J2TS4]
MNQQTYTRLEYDKLKQKLNDYAISSIGRQRIDELSPLTDLRMIENQLVETEEALQVIRDGVSVPIPSIEGVDLVFRKFGKGYLLTVDELTAISSMLDSVLRLKQFMKSKELAAPNLFSYVSALFELKSLAGDITQSIRHGRIADEASGELARIRKKLVIMEERIKKKVDSSMHRYRSYLQEYVISMRNDRYVLPVKKEFRKRVPGTVWDESASGQTVFIEPEEIAILRQEWIGAKAEEEREETVVLARLTEHAEQHARELLMNMETIGHYDFVFAKAKYARELDARRVAINNKGYIRIVEGRHPFLNGHPVPLHLTMGERYRSLIITGPNTGGKTVSLKTVGLLTMMVQSGLLVPVKEGSEFAVYNNLWVDIGDGQSMEQSLSTFSAHIRNVIDILKQADSSTLILLDELATGTDPGEGIGLSIAVLEELYRRGATVLATTHYNEIKTFAERTPGFENARMEFDSETLQPLYRLVIGEAGSSYAFQIALKLGIPEAIVERSRQITAAAVQTGEPVPPVHVTEIRGEPSRESAD